MPIRVLDAVTISKIAAGEVVERPASVLKELVENSLDAGARHITVELRGGGIDLIRITDDGCGIPPEQVRMAFENHATSKLREVKDLVDVTTLGFRGEALPSIAAVSKVEMTTRARGMDSGTRIELEAGNVLSVEPVGCPDGTTVRVRELFFNLPARRAFLKRPASEAGACQDTLLRLALGNPGVAFRLTSNGKAVFRTQGDGVLRHAVMAVYDRATAENMYEVDGSLGALRIYGLIGVGSSARASRAHQHFFVNGRGIRCAMLSQALEQACRGRVLIGRYPMCALNIELPPGSVDVNVHPGKLEVRFRDESGLFTAASVLMERAFGGENMLTPEQPVSEQPRPEILIASDESGSAAAVNEKAPDAGLGVVRIPLSAPDVGPGPAGLGGRHGSGKTSAKDDSAAAGKASSDGAQDAGEVRSAGDTMLQVGETTLAASMPARLGESAGAPIDASPAVAAAQAVTDAARTAAAEPSGEADDLMSRFMSGRRTAQAGKARGASGGLRSMAALRTDEAGAAPKEADVEARSDAPEPPRTLMEAAGLQEPDAGPAWRVVGTAFNTYIFVQYGDALYVIDQHAAHERILYERYMRQWENGTASQLLLTPYTVSVSASEKAQIMENRELLRDIGFEVDDFGDRDIQVRAVPQIMGEPDLRPFFLLSAAELKRLKSAPLAARREAVMQAACKHAVKGGDALSQAEIDSLLKQMSQTGAPASCPHGRPVIVAITRTELEKRFSRIV